MSMSAAQGIGERDPLPHASDHDRTALSRERRFAAALLAPAFLALIATTTFPLLFLVWISTRRMDLAMPFMDGFVGWENYRQLFADPRFWESLVLSLVYTVGTVVLQVVIGLALALLVIRMKRGQALFRMVAILPVVLSPAVVGMVWRSFMLTPEFGVIDYLAITAGLGSRNWLGDPTLAMVSVIVIHTWQWTPFAFMVLLASLASLPDDIYEAARIDRANAWQRFIRITLPLLRPAIVMVVIMRTMVALTAFAAIYTVTTGGPGTATEILNLYAYRKSFTELSLGYGATLAVALLVLTLAISALLFVIRRKD
ncbi:multiple sugar transport system permease protein [Rhizobium azooxidifex]|uniref:Multiple sugar transport system permease protein n=1 Tax=Mycoplana azooxidifex TaxID=1636188 RepID=A0A7W6D523_9HYPH|nr:sugar ABC transporter permease [Mycoplana azooxidifex]MBB3976237.1 multiple sugar transport system permease protein [Mycoplana azooxidifex]